MKKLLPLLLPLCLIGCRPTRPADVLIVNKVYHNSVQFAGSNKWYYLPIDSTADVGDTIAIHHNRHRQVKYPKITRRPF